MGSKNDIFIFSAFIMYGNLSLGGSANQLGMNDVYGIKYDLNKLSCLCLDVSIFFVPGMLGERRKIMTWRGIAIMGHYVPGPDKFNPSCLEGRNS